MKAWWPLVAVLPAAAHMVSISTGEIKIEGNRGRYEFRVPLFEIPHVKEPEKTLVGAIRFSSAGAEARRTETSCRRDPQENALICAASFEFAGPVEILDVVSSFHTHTVPNHVHLLRAVRDGATDQAVLDLSFPKAQIRFRPPTPFEVAFQQSVAGALRAIGGPAQWLFIAALVMAARCRRELLLLAGMFGIGEITACAALPLVNWIPAPRFVEAAAALTIAYLAVEILVLPQAGQRWLVVLILGLFHGLYFSIFTTSSQFEVHWVLLGVLVAEALVIALTAWILSRLARPLEFLQPVRAASVVLLVVGLGWFFVRLES